MHDLEFNLTRLPAFIWAVSRCKVLKLTLYSKSVIEQNIICICKELLSIYKNIYITQKNNSPAYQTYRPIFTDQLK